MITLLVLMTLSRISNAEKIHVEEPLRTDIRGVYLVTGTESGVKYNGACIIRQLDVSDSYFVVNVVGRVITQGIGLRTGDSLSISWSAGGTAHGVSVYRITGRTMTGRWSQHGQIHREQLSFLGDLPED